MQASHPPPDIVSAAVNQARQSPCAKSKRGAIAYHIVPPGNVDAGDAAIIGRGFNGPPGRMQCSGEASCLKDCGRYCVHAEMRAIMDAVHVTKRSRLLAGWVQLLHVKVDHLGALTAGGGPSCWQCSRHVLDEGIAGIWLYELPTITEENAGVVFPTDPPTWRYYDAQTFHEVTLRANKIAVHP